MQMVAVASVQLCREEKLLGTAMASKAGKGPAKSTLPWKWIIEYLASSEQVDLQLLQAVIEGAQLSDEELGENLRELIRLRCLERLCGSGNVTETTSGVPPDLDSGSTFELSRSCEDIVSDILRECSFNDFIWTGREPLKSKVRRFIAQKKISMPKPALQQLKDAILEGSHPNADSLKALSGLAYLSNRHRVSDENVEPSNICMHKADGRNHDNPDVGPNWNSDSAEHNRLKQLLRGDSSARAPCPSNKNPLVLDAESLSRNSDQTQLRDDNFPIRSPTAKRRKRAISDAAEPECAASLRANESDPENYVDAVEDIAQDSMETSDEDRVVKHGPLICDEWRGVSDRLRDESVPGVVARKSTPEGDQRTSRELTGGVAAGELPLSETIVRDAGDMMGQQHMEELSSDTDSDGFQNEEINFSMRRNKFLAAQCTSTGDSLQNLEGIRQTICMKCKEGGELLVCHSSNCSLVIHEGCVDSSTGFDENGDFLCLFCQYSNAMSERVAAKEEVTSARKELGEYICTMYEQWPENNLELLAEVCEEHGISQDEGEHQNPRQRYDCANKVNDCQRQSKGSAKEQGVQNLNGDPENEVNDYHRTRDDSSGDQAEHSQQSSDVNAASSIEQEEDASDGDATTAGIGENEKIRKGKAASSVPVREPEAEAFGKITVDIPGNQANGKVRKRRSAVRSETEVMAEDQGIRNDTDEPPRGASREEAAEDDIEDTDGEDASVAEHFISVRRRTNRRVSSSPVVALKRQKKRKK